jgi:hypothetical protein
MFCPYTATAQVAIGSVNDSITPGALLDLSQATDVGGLLLPQIVSADTATAVLKKPGMLVYNKTDGTVYTYNGTAWSAGGGSGGGGGSEPEPTPSPTSCSGSVMGVSGTVYPIGSYPYAQNDLKNLCWTLTNLKEPGQWATQGSDKTEARGYYYTAWGNTVCETQLGSNWHLPTSDQLALLIESINSDMTYEERDTWINPSTTLAGSYWSDRNKTSWVDVGTAVYLATNDLCLSYSNCRLIGLRPNELAFVEKVGIYLTLGNSGSDISVQSVRCVRSL